MNLLLTLHIALSMPALTADTPAALPVSAIRLAQLRTREDVVGVTVLEDGKPAPSNIVLPQLLNRQQTWQFMLIHYPESLRNSVSNSTPIGWVFVDKSGNVGSAELVTFSGQPELDSLSLQVLRIAWFKPAQIDAQPVGVWTPLPARIPPYADLAKAVTATQDNSGKPVASTFTSKPVLLNRNQVEAAIIRVIYSMSERAVQLTEAFNRAQSVGGTTTMSIQIDATGSVINAVVKKTSGNAELDRQAVEIARLMRFSPAKNGDQAVELWMDVPIMFRAK